MSVDCSIFAVDRGDVTDMAYMDRLYIFTDCDFPTNKVLDQRDFIKTINEKMDNADDWYNEKLGIEKHRYFYWMSMALNFLFKNFSSTGFAIVGEHHYERDMFSDKYTLHLEEQ
jgi:hypothetical protein